METREEDAQRLEAALGRYLRELEFGEDGAGLRLEHRGRSVKLIATQMREDGRKDEAESVVSEVLDSELGRKHADAVRLLVADSEGSI